MSGQAAQPWQTPLEILFHSPKLTNHHQCTHTPFVPITSLSDRCWWLIILMSQVHRLKFQCITSDFSWISLMPICFPHTQISPYEKLLLICEYSSASLACYSLLFSISFNISVDIHLCFFPFWYFDLLYSQITTVCLYWSLNKQNDTYFRILYSVWPVSVITSTPDFFDKVQITASLSRPNGSGSSSNDKWVICHCWKKYKKKNIVKCKTFCNS